MYLRGTQNKRKEVLKMKSEIFDLSTIKGIERAEKEQERLYEKYDNVKFVTIGLDKGYFDCH